MKKLIFLIVFLISLTKISLFSPKLTQASFTRDPMSGGQWYTQSTESWSRNAFNTAGPNGEQYFLFAYTNIINSTIAAIGGVPESALQPAQGPNGHTYGYTRKGGAINIIADITGNLYTNPPASSVEYLADLGQNIGIVKPTYAQGIGFSGFSPVLTLWKTFRDLAYLGFVVIFVIVGFMIMFRKKIDPRTVVTIQESLPRIVVALILVTFSYALAGLVVDLGDLLTRLIASILYNGNLLGVVAVKTGNLDSFRQELLQSNIFKLVNPLRQVGALEQAIGEVGAGPTDISLGPINLAQITVKLAFWLAGFFIMFKIFFALLGPYISILLSVIFAPFQLLLTALPGGNSSLTSWLKGLLANVLVFPVTFAMLAIAAILKAGSYMSQCPPPPSPIAGEAAKWCTGENPITSLWSPATIGNWGPAMGELAGWGILFTIPKVVELVQETLQHKPSVVAGAAGEETTKAFGRVPFIGGLLTGR